MTEKQIQNGILLKFGAVDYMRIWRVNVGMAYSFHEVGALKRMLMGKDYSNASKYVQTLNPIRFGQKGHSDIAGIMCDGRGIYIEVKSETGKISPEQGYFRDMILKHKGIHIIARSEKDVEDKLTIEGYLK